LAVEEKLSETGMEEGVQEVIDFLQAHTALAAPIMFVVAFAESLAFLSLLVPGWGIMVAAGALAGSGMIDPWPVVLGAIPGAVFGDTVSYWVGRKFGHSVVNIWPFSKHPELLPRGHAFFEKYGGWSVALGRFFGPIRAVIPLIAGIMEMPRAQFWCWNVASAFVWAPVVVFSGARFGWAAANARDWRIIAVASVVLLIAALWTAKRSGLLRWGR
jgi:membrane protein DedA with SNARE-associated domain